MSTKRKTILICGCIVCALVTLGLFFPVIQEGDRISSRQFFQLTMQYLVTAADGYRREYGDWPQGDIARVTRTLCGDNPRKIVFTKIDARFINSHGRPTDAWGTAIKLSVAGERVSSTSAGKDKTFGTSDDIGLSKP